MTIEKTENGIKIEMKDGTQKEFYGNVDFGIDTTNNTLQVYDEVPMKNGMTKLRCTILPISDLGLPEEELINIFWNRVYEDFGI